MSNQSHSIDLVFVVDETGSMGGEIRAVQNHLLEMVRVISEFPTLERYMIGYFWLTFSLRIGLIGYRDHPPQDFSFVTRVAELSEDIEMVKVKIDNMAAGGGGDMPECLDPSFIYA